MDGPSPKVFKCRKRDRQLEPYIISTGETYTELSNTTVEFEPFVDVRENDVLKVTNTESLEVVWPEVIEVDAPVTGETKRVTTCREHTPVA